MVVDISRLHGRQTYGGFRKTSSNELARPRLRGVRGRRGPNRTHSLVARGRGCGPRKSWLSRTAWLPAWPTCDPTSERQRAYSGNRRV
jgi:hypothetical protein